MSPSNSEAVSLVLGALMRKREAAQVKWEEAKKAVAAAQDWYGGAAWSDEQLAELDKLADVAWYAERDVLHLDTAVQAVERVTR